MKLQNFLVSLVLIFVVLTSALVSYGSIAIMSQRVSAASGGIVLASAGVIVGQP